MPVLGSFAAGSTKGFGGTSFVCSPRCITYDFMVIGGGGGGGSGDIGGGEAVAESTTLTMLQELLVLLKILIVDQSQFKLDQGELSDLLELLAQHL